MSRKEPPFEACHTPQETKLHYVKLINSQFRGLQLDHSLKSMSIFDLIDHCEMLYEELSSLVNTEEGITTYIKGYLIFNYFINSFIMMHFKGFDLFIESNKQDFIIYLNVFAFYNTDDIIHNDSYTVPLRSLRKWVLEYLSLKGLLSFDVNELYNWLYEYIDYLKAQDTPQLPEPPKSPTLSIYSHDSLDSLTNFTNRYPSLKMDPPPPPESPPPVPQHTVSKPRPLSTPYPLEPKERAPYPLTSSVDDLQHTKTEPVLPTLSNKYQQPIYPQNSQQSFSSDSLPRAGYVRPPLSVPVPGPPVPLPSNVHANGSFKPTYLQKPYQQPAPNPYHSQQRHYQPKYVAPDPHAQKLQYMSEYAICGLKNFGSSCYINSTIQMIFGIAQFKQLFTNLTYHKYIQDPKFVKLMKMLHNLKDSLLLSEAISGLLRSFILHGGASIAPTKFLRVSSLLKPDFHIPHEQQDAQELLLFILERLHEELSYKDQVIDPFALERNIAKWNINIDAKDRPQYLKWYQSLIESEGTSPINDMFQGHLQNKLICNKCGHELINYSPFTILSLPIPSKNLNEVVDLADCLRYYSQDEVLTGENAWKCPKCNKSGLANSGHALDNHPVFTPKRNGIFRLAKRSKSPSKNPNPPANGHHTSISIKTLTFIKLPQVFFIHLSRFSMFDLTDKLDTVIKYPLQLKFNNHSNNIRHEITYKLVGLINHYGNLKSGHYTSLVNKSTVHVKSNSDNLKQPYWCLFDDESVKLNLAHGHFNELDQDCSNLNSRDVYVLCYERYE